MSKGFTLVELVVTVAIVGILAAVAVPSFTGLTATMQVKADASNLYLSLMRARSEAVKRNAAITISAVGGEWKSGWSISEGIESQGAGKAEVVSADASVTYNPNGRVSGGGTVTFEVSSPNTSTVRCITIGLSGQPTVKSQGC